MSGIEVAGLVFGVLPLLIEAVKAYSSISDGFHTFRHYSREIKSSSVQLKVHNGIFLNECRLLLRLVEDEKGVKDMLEDEVDRRWTSKQFNDRLNAALRDNFELCRSIIEETKDIIEGLRKELNQFDVLLDEKKQGESIKSAIRRLRGAIKISFDKSKYQRYLAELRDRNGDLSHLRAQIGAFQQQDTCASGTSVRHRALPTRFQSIQTASQKLHEALCGAWCCDDLSHRGHYAKLCVDADVQAEVRLDLAISCQQTPSELIDGLMQEPPIWLYVQSMSIDARGYDEKTKEAAISLQEPLSAVLSGSSSSSTVLKKKASSDLAQPTTCRKRKKRVHFINDQDTEAPQNLCNTISAVVAQQTTQMLNLCQAKNICHYLKRNLLACDGSVARRCVGYLETPKMYRHLFYLRKEKRSTSATSTSRDLAAIRSIFDIMRQEADDVLEVKDQLQLAHKTALAILQFNDTPWLPERWRLRDMSYFGSQRVFDEAALKSLHLSSQIASSIRANTLAMDGVERAQEAAVSEEVRYGINNTTLFFLGVALLEIAHWAPLEEKMTSRDLNNEIFAARRLASARAPLGPEYQKLAQKCLQCNFGFGTQLGNKGLQAAVYNDVVCSLEKMMDSLSV